VSKVQHLRVNFRVWGFLDVSRAYLC
jgi:hypothetical protein